jgi:hypothetical protein
MAMPSILKSVVSQPSKQEIPPAVKALVTHLCQHYGPSVQGILFYGSCLRTKTDQGGLVDLYILVDNNRATAPNVILAALNKVLPPNVYYLEIPFEDRIVRAKYAMLTLADFQKGTSSAWFHSYLWGRFAQPTGILYSANEQITHQIQEALAQAVWTFVQRARPQVPETFDAREFWQIGLSLSYQAELRAESSERVHQLIADNPDYYEQITEAALSELSQDITIDKTCHPPKYHHKISSEARWANWWAWRIRQLLGKGLSIGRLMKGVFTFHGGLDYIVWKIERHSGVTVEITPTQRKHPILTGIVVFWKLYRQGAFR